MRENERLMTIQRFENQIDAELAKMTLENEGIPCYLAGTTILACGPYSTINAVELQVFEPDAERAAEILEECAPAQGEDFDVEEEADVDERGDQEDVG